MIGLFKVDSQAEKNS